MPTVEGYVALNKEVSQFLLIPRIIRLKRALERVDAGPGGPNVVYWTSLREVRLVLLEICIHSYHSPQEPVIYVAGRPHVLRLENRPLENVEYVRISLGAPEFKSCL